MVKNLLIYVLFPITTGAQVVAGSLSVEDTRLSNQAPSQYIGHRMGVEFKDRGTVGAPGEGAYSGMLTIAPWQDNTGNKYHQLNFNDGGIFYRTGMPQDAQWGSWGKILTADSNGNVQVVGITNPEFQISNTAGRFGILRSSCSGCGARDAREGDTVLRNFGLSHNMILELNDDNNDGNSYVAVSDNLHGNWVKFFNNRTAKIDGKVSASEVEVKTNVWADYIFDQGYRLPTLRELAKQISDRGHLPGIPSKEEVLRDGVNLGDMDTRLLAKIEELTLYAIGLDSKNLSLEAENRDLRKAVESLARRVHDIEAKTKH